MRRPASKRAIIGSVSFPDCLLAGLRAEACNFAGGLSLNSGCTVRTEVRLARATIGKDLNCERLRLRSSDRSISLPRRRLMADGAHIAGDAILAGGFEADGDVRLVGVRIAGDLQVQDARLTGSVDSEGVRGDALNLDRMRVAGRVSFDKGFSAAGTVRLKRARIDGDLDCNGAAFDVFGDMSLGGCASLLLDCAKVGGSLVLTRYQRPLIGVAGRSRRSARCTTISRPGAGGSRSTASAMRASRTAHRRVHRFGCRGWSSRSPRTWPVSAANPGVN